MKKGRYRYRVSIRMQKWDYAWDAAYFITICTKDRKHYFGEVVNGEMYLSNTGVLADVFWFETKNHSKNIELGSFVVMPDHVHGIIILKDNEEFVKRDPTDERTPGERRFRNQGCNTISSIVGSYKSAVTKHANRLGYVFGWQSRFYDTIIRNDVAYQRISDYIANNPKTWKDTMRPR